MLLMIRCLVGITQVKAYRVNNECDGWSLVTCDMGQQNSLWYWKINLTVMRMLHGDLLVNKSPF